MVFNFSSFLQQFLVVAISFYVANFFFWTLQFILCTCLPAVGGLRLALWVVNWQPRLVTCATCFSVCAVSSRSSRHVQFLPSVSHGVDTPPTTDAPDISLPNTSVIDVEAAMRFQQEIESLRQDLKASSPSRPDLENRMFDLQHELLMLMSMEVGNNIRKIEEIVEQLQGVNNIRALRAMVIEEVRNHTYLSEAVSKDLVRAIAKREIAGFMLDLMREPDETAGAEEAVG